jgi:hypothetical protein
MSEEIDLNRMRRQVSFDRLLARCGPRKSLVNPRRNYDVAPDGKRIIAVMPVAGAEGQPQHHVIFQLNFFDELRRCVLTEK